MNVAGRTMTYHSQRATKSLILLVEDGTSESYLGGGTTTDAGLAIMSVGDRDGPDARTTDVASRANAGDPSRSVAYGAWQLQLLLLLPR